MNFFPEIRIIHFLIEKAELDAFKTAFAQKDMELYFDQNNLSIDSLICDFEQWLIGQ